MFNHLKKKVAGSHVGSSSSSSSSKGKGKGKAALVMEDIGQVNDVKKIITLKTIDGFTFEVEEGVMLQSDAIKHMIEEGCAIDDIPLQNVTGDVLDLVIEYCKNHYNKMASDEEAVKKWDAEFINVEQQTLYDLIMAADYLSVKGLLDLAVQKVADMIKGKMPEEIRRIFNITNDFTPEEEAAIRSENMWAFE